MSTHVDESRATADDLRQIPLFAELSEGNLFQLAQTVGKLRAETGTRLCAEGDQGDRMYVILDGTVTLSKRVNGADHQLGRLERGAHFGEMALIGEAPRTATIEAATDIEYLAIDRDTLMRVIGAYPSVALQILRGYNSRLSETTQRLARLTARIDVPDSAVGLLSLEQRFDLVLEQMVEGAPYPLARIARRLQVEQSPIRQVQLSLDIFEIIVRSTTLVLVADYLRCPTVRTAELDESVMMALRRPTMGLMIEISGRLLRAMGAIREQMFMPELYCTYFQDGGGRSSVFRALQALNAYRNRLKHGADSVWDEDAYRADFEGTDDDNDSHHPGLREQISTLLWGVRYLCRYPLVQLISMTFEHGAFEHTFERCTGAYPDFARGTLISSQPLEHRHLYVVREHDERVLPLEPLVRRVKCSECAQLGIFHLFAVSLDREQGGGRRERLEYSGHACGHTMVENVSAERVAKGGGLGGLIGSHAT
jgi:CRP-like cAMP-binding protein